MCRRASRRALGAIVAALIVHAAPDAAAEHALWIVAREQERVVHFDIDRRCMTAAERVRGNPAQLDWDAGRRQLLVSRIGTGTDTAIAPPVREAGGITQIEPRRLTRREFLAGQPVVDAVRLDDGRLVAVVRSSLIDAETDAILVLDRFGYRVLHDWPIDRALDPMQLVARPGEAGAFLVVCRRGAVIWGRAPGVDGGVEPLRIHDLFAWQQPAVADSARHAQHSIHFAAIDADDRAWIPQSDVHRIFELDMADGAMQMREGGSEHHVHAVAVDSRRLYLAERALSSAPPNSWLAAFDLETLEPIYRQPLDVTGHQAVVCERHGQLWLTTNDGLLLAIGTSSGVLVDQFEIGGSLWDLALIDDDAPPAERPCLSEELELGGE